MKYAKWIWRKQKNYNPFNQTVVARHTFKLSSVREAVLAITADSWYRVFVNGAWVNDGPCRSWPEHYQYDVLDVAPYLRGGENEVVVIARYFGIGTFHQVPQQAGLAAELTVTDLAGRQSVVATDGQWEMAEASAWLPNTPKVSIQMEPFEHYVAARGAGLKFAKAAVLFDLEKGPWKDLHPRDCALLTKEPVAFKRFVEANVVQDDWLGVTFPVARLLYPGLVEANRFVSLASVFATLVRSPRKRRVRIEALDTTITVNGRPAKDGVFELKAGDNFVFVAVTGFFGHRQKDISLHFSEPEGLSLHNPVWPDDANPWCFAPLPEGRFIGNDICWMDRHDAAREAFRDATAAKLEQLLRDVANVKTFAAALGHSVKRVPASEMLMDDAHGQFVHRSVTGSAAAAVRNPEALIYDNAAVTAIAPVPKGDIELVYDLGEQRCGYYTFELTAHDGVTVDVFALEYITPGGRLQHTGDNRNGLRYVCKDGLNTFTSLKRRSGRYLFVTLRGVKHPIRIRKLQVVESTYPVAANGAFASSDPALDRIWEISARTLKLCMEDTYTDCPLYEQTHWVGDARNESVFGFTAFGAADLAKRCVRLTAQSLERFPIAGCQVPSGWECLLPAWSFLWGISAWDYYFHSGDKAFLREVWPALLKNLDGAKALVDERGLFSGPFWNMFDWIGIDDGHKTVLHNSMFVVGAIDAALKCAEALGEKQAAQELGAWRKSLVKAINKTWDAKKGAYPDSIHDDGKPSASTCQHTSFLGLLYDIVEPKNRKKALQNLLKPPKGMIRIGSPFAIMYLYEAFDKLGLPEAIMASIRESYQPMLDLGATTVWEVFGRSNVAFDEFPTRSHCHAWSSAPVHFLNRIVLGIRQTAVGGTDYEISPWVSDLDWAKGATAGIKGGVSVSWRKDGDRLLVEAGVPKGVKVRFVPNATHKGYKVAFAMRQL